MTEAQQKTIARKFDHALYEARLRTLYMARDVLDDRRVGSKSEAALVWNDTWMELLKDAAAFHLLSDAMVAIKARDLLTAVDSGSYRDVQDAQRELFDLIEREERNGY